MTPGNLGLRLALVATCLLMAGCASAPPAKPVVAVIPPAEKVSPEGLYKVGQPYQIDGIWYYPSENYSYREEGVASWYGADFHGKRTANGETFDMNSISAAHPTLPMPSQVKVTNLDNGRELTVRVNDRGPFKSNRIIDMSRRAAQVLGFDQAGTARVRVEIDPDESMRLKNLALRANPGEMPKIAAAPTTGVKVAALPAPTVAATPLPAAKPTPPRRTAVALPAPTPTKNLKGAPVPMRGEGTIPAQPPAASGPGIYVQAGAFSEMNNARRLEQELKEFGNSFVLPVTVNNRQMFRVRLGPLADDEVAEAVLGRVRSYGYDDAQIVRY